MGDLITRFSLPLLVTSLAALLAALYFMVNADREAEEAPFLHQRRAALALAKASRFVIGALVVIVLELTLMWIGTRFPSATAPMESESPPATSSGTPLDTATVEPTLTATLTAIPPTSTPTLTATPTLSPTPTATPTPAFLSYTIQAGDTFSELALQFGTSVAAIEAANPDVNPNRLQIGQDIRIPVPTATPSPGP